MQIKNPETPIRQFSKYLVIAGAVFGCMQLIFAGTMVIFGHRDAGAKALVAGGGLIMLFGAFTIWKIDMFNFYNARGLNQDPSKPDSYNVDAIGAAGNPPLTAEQQVTGSHTYEGDNTHPNDIKSAANGGATRPRASLPIIPASTSSINRSGLPLLLWVVITNTNLFSRLKISMAQTSPEQEIHKPQDKTKAPLSKETSAKSFSNDSLDVALKDEATAGLIKGAPRKESSATREVEINTSRDFDRQENSALTEVLTDYAKQAARKADHKPDDRFLLAQATPKQVFIPGSMDASFKWTEIKKHPSDQKTERALEDYRTTVSIAAEIQVEKLTKNNLVSEKDVQDLRVEAAKIFPAAGMAQNLLILELAENKLGIKPESADSIFNSEIGRALKISKLVGPSQHAFDLAIRKQAGAILNSTEQGQLRQYEQKVQTPPSAKTHISEITKSTSLRQVEQEIGRPKLVPMPRSMTRETPAETKTENLEPKVKRNSQEIQKVITKNNLTLKKIRKKRRRKNRLLEKVLCSELVISLTNSIRCKPKNLRVSPRSRCGYCVSFPKSIR